MDGRAAVVLVQDRHVLLVRRQTGTNDEFSFPGGEVRARAGETPAQAAVRKFQEETGIEIWGVIEVWRVQDGQQEEYCFMPTELPEMKPDGVAFALTGTEAHRPLCRLEWIPLERLYQYPVVPAAAKRKLLEMASLLQGEGKVGVLLQGVEEPCRDYGERHGGDESTDQIAI